MLRRLLLLLTGLGTCAVALVLWSGSAHALSPATAVPLARTGSVPVHAPVVGVPARAPRPTPAPLPPIVHTVAPVVSGAAPVVGGVVREVGAVVPAVVARVSPVLPARGVAPRGATPAPSRVDARSAGRHAEARAARTSRLQPRGFSTVTGRTRAAAPQPSSHRSAPALLLADLADLSGRALGPTQSSIGMPFALHTRGSLIVSTWSRRLAAPAGDHPRPGFMVGIACPG